MKKRDFTKGSILGNILTFSLPYMLSYFLQILYGLADLFVTGRYCNVASITSVSNGAQVMYMFTVVIIGLAMGTTVLVARSVGANDQRRIAQTIGNTVTMFLVFVSSSTNG
jgi:Na+-driven multidrug efflux pump